MDRAKLRALALLRDAALGLFDVVVVVDLDRLTRSEDMTERGAIIGAFQRAGVRIATTSGQMLDLATSTGDLFATLQAFFAAEENRKRRERVTRGKLAAAQRGGKATGRDPYGLRYVNREWSLDPVRSPIVAEIYERVAAGESCGHIADDLELRRVPAVGANGWNRNRVRDLVRSRHAAGEFMAHRASRTVVSVPAIVSENLWQRAQDALTAGRTRGLGRTRHVYMLEGLAVCRCGAPMRIRSSYVTRGRWRRPSVYRCGAQCGAVQVPTEQADAAAWGEICRRLEQPSLVRELAELDAEQGSDADTWDKDATTAQAHLDRLAKVETTIMARFRRGLISEAGLDAELAALRRERTAASAQLRTATRARGQAIGAQGRIQAASVAIGELRAALAVADAEDRRAIVRLLVEQGGVTVADGAITVDLWVPRGASARNHSAAVVGGSSYSDDHESRLKIRVVARVA
jgi:site-specific DNA recombinase